MLGLHQYFIRDEIRLFSLFQYFAKLFLRVLMVTYVCQRFFKMHDLKTIIGTFHFYALQIFV